jgi:uncharacterized protein DUF1573
MKRFLLVLTAGFILFACNQDDKKIKSEAQTNSGTAKDSAALTTILWLDSTFQNLGKVTKGQVVEVAYRFRNTGDKPLIIYEARAGCGCTVTNPPKEPIAPGAEETIRAKFDSKNQDARSHTKNITVTANTTPQQAHHLTFSVEVKE